MRSFGNTTFWCHLSVETGDNYTNRKIRESKPIKCPTFKELVQTVATISNHNPDYSLFFRGQAKDYQLKSEISSFYPTIFRSPGRKLTAKELGRRFDVLDECSIVLIKKLKKLGVENIAKIKKFPELQWSILQHYGVCDTPLLDMTHSLRVAASFAYNEAKDKGCDSAYVFIYALPYPNGTISYSTEEEFLNVKLISASPSKALRPHFQEGYLVGTFPSRVDKKQASLDFGRKLLAKINIPLRNFWSKNFHNIPNDALYPRRDEMESLCLDIKNKHNA